MLDHVNHPHEYVYALEGENETIFRASDNGVQLAVLFGMACRFGGADSGIAQAKGLVSLATDIGCSDMAELATHKSVLGSDSLELLWDIPDTGIAIKSNWAFCGQTGIWSRKDCISNPTKRCVTLYRYLSRFSLTPGLYEIYSQGSRWCDENDGRWQEIRHGSIVLACENGRTTQGGTPFVCIRNKNTGYGAVFHVLPIGNWVIRVSAKTASGNSLPFVSIELGLADENLHLTLDPGQSMEAPEILIQELVGSEPQFAAPRLHRYLLSRGVSSWEFDPPVVYNTWFDVFDYLDSDRLVQQLMAAKSIGCEVFTVDAGWYGSQQGDWFAQAGDWSEKLDGAFYGHMDAFAEKVRSMGLGFGLWMEPERIGPQAPILKQHPEWFRPAGNGSFYANLRRIDAYNYIKSEMSRLIDTYQLAWLKLDFNFDLGIDPEGSEFSWYYDAWYRLLDELKKHHANVFIEGCASGGMRLELSMLAHCHAHFLSDTVDPLAVLNIFQGAILRLPPGRLGKWAVLRSIGNNIPKYGTSPHQSPDTLVAPGGATWETAKTVNVDFAVLTAMSGVLGFSGDIEGLPKSVQDRLRLNIEFYKKYRWLIGKSIGYLLTPLQRDPHHWLAVQLQSCQNTESILFVYRLDDSISTNQYRLRALDEEKRYWIEYWDGRKKIQHLSGRTLMKDGITVVIPERMNAVAISIRYQVETQA